MRSCNVVDLAVCAVVGIVGIDESDSFHIFTIPIFTAGNDAVPVEFAIGIKLNRISKNVGQISACGVRVSEIRVGYSCLGDMAYAVFSKKHCKMWICKYCLKERMCFCFDCDIDEEV